MVGCVVGSLKRTPALGTEILAVAVRFSFSPSFPPLSPLFPLQPGRYFIAVFAYGRPGHFGLSIGEVEWFYFSEFLLGPIYAIKGWIWTGQSVGLALIGLWVSVLGGLMILSWQGCYLRHSPRSYFNWVVCMGGFIVMSSAFVVIEELFYS